jgi:hypothetical protein
LANSERRLRQCWASGLGSSLVPLRSTVQTNISVNTFLVTNMSTAVVFTCSYHDLSKPAKYLQTSFPNFRYLE